jgi:predicted esterase
MSNDPDPQVTRRRFAHGAVGIMVSLVAGRPWRLRGQGRTASSGRLLARPRSRATGSLQNGALGIGGARDALIQVPARASTGAAPLLVFLHGATQDGAAMLRRIGPVAEELGIVLLAPDSRNGTWDGIRDGFGEDVAFIDRALAAVFERLDVDASRLAIGGFSDGASYALALGLANGDLFRHVVACSPGFIPGGAPPQGRPRVFISHGTADQILPIDRCSRVIVPQLRAKGYQVNYREFEGRHTLPPDVAREGLRVLSAS